MSHKQTGSIALLLVAMLLFSMTGILLANLNINQIQAKRQAQTAAALLQAKQALLGYAVTYAETHTGESYGFLPCPDLKGSNGQGSSNLSCGLRNISMLGRLPWKSFELDALRDGHAECIWYAVSGTFKSIPKTEWLNCDTTGLLQVYAPDGTTLLADEVVAAVMAPNRALDGQSRIGNTSICNGNYQANQYLENSGTINNAALSAGALSVSSLIQGSASSVVNDTVLYLTRQEIFDVIKRRPAFVSFVHNMLNQANTCLTNLPAPVTLNFSAASESLGGNQIGALETGRVRKSCLPNPFRHWQDNLLYARCSSGQACLSVNGASCRGVIIFSGEATAQQTRKTPTQKNDWQNYLEGGVFLAIATGNVQLSAASLYQPHLASADVLSCIA